MPVRLRESEIAELIQRMKVYRNRGVPLMKATQKVADDMGIPQTAVYSWVKRLRPTTEVATEYIRSQSLKLAMRVVRKANVDQSMQILSRPNIGVLDPPGDGGGGGGRQFVVGVAIDSLGSVKVGVQIGTGQPGADSRKGLGAGSAEDAGPVLDISPEVEGNGEEWSGADADGAGGELEEPEPVSVPRRRWYRPDPKPREESVAPAPVAEGQIFGRGLDYRLAVAKAERREAAKKKRQEREAVSKRAKELKVELARARGDIE